MVGKCILQLILVCLLSVGGCGPQAPQYVDPLADLSGARGDNVPTDVPVKAGASVALTLGSNVERFLKYHDDGRVYAASVGASKDLLEQGNPQYLVDGGVAILKRRYPKIKSFDDLASAAREHVATTFVLDIRTKAGMYPGDETTVDLTIIAFDAHQKPISKITARGATQIKPYAAPRIRDAHDQALAELTKKADRLLH